MPRQEKRKLDSEGRPMPFTCINYLFQTADVGLPHGEYNPHALGSVEGEPLALDPVGGGSLWLEHVETRATSTTDLYWLMWYDAHGYPQSFASGVLTREALTTIGQRLIARFVP